MEAVRGSTRSLLSDRKAAILSKWREGIVSSYPAETALFLKSAKDPFANPVGSAIAGGTESVFDSLVADEAPEETVQHLEEFIRIRAIQDFSPADAIGFVFLLKEAIREALGTALKQAEVATDLLRFESRIDRVALQALNLYVQCRERVLQLRIEEVKRQTAVILKRAGFGGLPEGEDAVLCKPTT